jgi:hypothetical protein
MLEINSSINQMKSTVESFINRVDKGEERISEIEDKIVEPLHSDSNKEK